MVTLLSPLVNRASETPGSVGAKLPPPAEPSTSTDAHEEVLRAQKGDRVALDAVVRRYHEDVARVLWRFARQRTDLDDLVQETFLRALRNLKQWRSDRPFIHWLRRIAANTGRDYYRRHVVRRRWQADLPVDENGEAPQLPEAIDPQLNPAAKAAAEEVKTLLSQLSPDDAALLTLHYLEGWGLQDIAAAYGWTHTATKLRAWRARARLRALYEPNTSAS